MAAVSPTDKVMEFRVVWWNTKLAFVKGDKSTTATVFAHAASILRALLTTEGVGLICLGEIDEDAHDRLSEALGPSSIYLLRFDENIGRQEFNMALLVRPDIITYVKHEALFDVVGGYFHKIAIKVTLLLEERWPLTVFLTHWPSKLYQEQSRHKHEDIAGVLRKSIDEILSVDINAHILVLGDFNDDPFSEAVSEYLMSTKEVDRLRKNPRLLYNPFWRKIQSPNPIFRGSRADFPLGSYYYKGGKINRWRLFDQILFSSSFVSEGGEWHIDERGVSILDHTFGMMQNISSNSHFDHYPVIALVERKDDERL